MRTFSKRFLGAISLVLIAAVAAMTLAACSSSAPAAAPTKAPEPAKAAEPTKPAAPAATTAAAPAATTAPAAAPAAAAVSFPKMDVKLGHGGVLDMSYHKGNVKFSELMKERSGGNVNVQVFPNSQLGSEKDMLEQVKNGVIQISLTTPVMLANYEGWGQIGVTAMPYIFKGDTDEDQYPALMKMMRGPLFKEVNDKAAKISGIRGLDLGWWYGTRNLTNKVREIKTADDIKGLKVRTMDAPLARGALDALGAATTPMAVAELYSAMQMGVVDGQENPYNTIYASKYHEVQKYLAATGHMTMTVLMVCNDKWFQSFTPEQQAVIVKSMQDAGDYQSDIQLKMNNQNLKDLQTAGLVFSKPDKAQLAEKTKDVYKQFGNMFTADFYTQVKNGQ
ncbi:MAG TPA: TRAP transporter substrate-binding protein [Chloroflexota bacterium]|nr:TRAP transporter substrate-binding protein [Chloroflexota bacterium]